MDPKELQNIVRAIIQASPKPVTLEALCEVFSDDEEVQLVDIQDVITTLLKAKDPAQELKSIAGGYHYHIKPEYTPWVKKSQDPESKTESLSRALLETLAIIAYKQPISRGEVDYIRGKTTAADLFAQLEE